MPRLSRRKVLALCAVAVVLVVILSSLAATVSTSPEPAVSLSTSRASEPCWRSGVFSDGEGLRRLQWVDGFVTRRCENPLFCSIPADVSMVIADAFELQLGSVLALGLYRVSDGRPSLTC
eukprot:RCo032719